MTFPSRTREARRAEYERNIATKRQWYRRHKETPDYARKLLARELAIPACEVPQELVDLRFQQIQIQRAIKDGVDKTILPKLVERYLAGETCIELAADSGLDRERITKAIREAGVTLRRRPTCKKGHVMNLENTAFTPQGWRRCRKCACEKTKRYYNRRKNGELASTSRGQECDQ